MKHLSESDLGALLDGALAGAPLANAERHVAECAACRDALARLAAQDRELARVLEHDPGDAYFESFAARVQQRIRAEGVAIEHAIPETPVRAPERGRDPGSVLERVGRWLSGPRLTMVGAAAALVVGAGIVFLSSHETPVPTLRESHPARSGAIEGGGTLERPRPAGELEQGRPAEDAARSSAPAPQSTVSRAAPHELSRGPVPATAAPAPATAPSAFEAPPASTTESSAESAPEPPAAPAEGVRKAQSQALPQRSREVRREGGEDVPVAKPSDALFERSKGSENFAAPSPGATPSRLKAAQRQLEVSPLRAQPKEANETKRLESPELGAANPGATGAAASRALERDASGNARLCGTVRDTHGRPIDGALVAFADLGVSARTDTSGHWCLEAPAGERTLMVMALGFHEYRRAVTTAPGSPDRDVTLAAVPVLETEGQREGRAAESKIVWPRGAEALAVAAERATAEAARQNSAQACDRAAFRWERVVGAVKSGPASIAARRSLADARYRAWQLGPSPARASVAIAALESFIAHAPAGPERDQAKAKLEQLRNR